MTTLARMAIALITALFLSSCNFDLNFGSGVTGNSTVAEESRSVTEEFTEVHASEGLDVYVTQSDQFSIEVEADENVIDLIGTDIKDGELRIHCIENIGRATKKIYVTLPEITSLESSSGADLSVTETITATDLNLHASSGSDLSIEVEAQDITAHTSSGADIRISGKTQHLKADASSGSDIKAQELLAETCNAEASSGADISVNVSEKLVAVASSGADVKYTGDASVESTKSAAGSIRKF
jgi:hypothetical protein